MKQFLSKKRKEGPFKQLHFIALLILLLISAQDLLAQVLNKKVQMEAGRVTGLKLVAAIKEQVPEVRFTFEEAVSTRLSGTVNLKTANPGVEEILNLLRSTFSIIFKNTGNYILLTLPGTQKDTKQSGTGSIKGRVVEFETAQPLPGASVFFVELKKGVQTNDAGYYHFEGLLPGKYTLRISYVSFNTEKLVADVKEGKESTIDVKLSSSNALNEVVINARTARLKTAVSYTSEKELLSEMRSARAVVSGISNEQIIKSTDRNAAEVVKRISGVTVVDDKFIVVRGMNARYNLTYLNGNIAPATELYSRTFAYDLLPSPIIDRILVYKSPTANLMGDYAGGAVEVFTKNAKPVRHLNMGLQTGYRPNSNFGNTINSYQGGKTDWLGFDDGTRRLSKTLSNADIGVTGLSQRTLLKAFSPVLQYGTKKSTPDIQGFANYFDSWRLGKWRLYNLSSLTYSKETTHFNIYRQGGNLYSFGSASGNFNVGDLNSYGTDDQSTEKSKLNLLQNFTLKIDSNNKIVFNNFLLNEGNNTTGIENNKPNILPASEETAGYRQNRKITLSYQQRSLYAGNLGAEHLLNANKDRLKWNLGYSVSRQDVPDQRVINFYNLYIPGGLDRFSVEQPDSRWRSASLDGYKNLFFGKISRIFTRNTEQIANASADYDWNVIRQLALKVGTYHSFRAREVSRRSFKVNQGNLTGHEVSFENQPIDEQYGYGTIDFNKVNFRQSQLANVWSESFFPEDLSGLRIFDATTAADSYNASEQNNSAYVMGDWRPGDGSLIVNGGLRIEYNQQKIAGAYRTPEGFILPVSIVQTKTVVLPSVNTSYQPDSAFTLRASYGKTVNRPEFRELTPYNDYDFLNNELIIGNPNVVTAQINNYDFRFEFYPNKQAGKEMLSVGVFYKNINKPIQRIRNESTTGGNAPLTEISFINADRAKLYGLELEMRKSLSFIPGNLFRNLSVVANGTIIKSKTEKSNFIDDGEEYRIGRFKDRRLQGQAPYVINAGLFYENPGWGTKIGLSYVMNGPNIYALSIRNPNSSAGGINGQDTFRPDLVELERHLVDLSFSQRLLRTLTMRLNVQNILDKSYRLIEDYNRNQKFNPEKAVVGANGSTYYSGDNLYRSYNPGRYFTMNFTYAF